MEATTFNFQKMHRLLPKEELIELIASSPNLFERSRI